MGVDEYEVAVHVPVHHGSSERGQKKRTPASVASEALLRARWLCALLVLQSLSGSVLAAFERLIRKHLVVTLFLTMVRACRLQRSLDAALTKAAARLTMILLRSRSTLSHLPERS